MDTTKVLLNKSSRHHYIPKFLVEGFTNDEGLLYVFDKKKNRILSKPQPPKSIFFEPKRNTVEVKEGQESSVIEDEIYSKMDNRASKIVKYYQNGVLNEIDFTAETSAEFLFFLVTLFWRIPYTDYASLDLIYRSKIDSKYIDPEVIRRDPLHQKFARVGLFKHAAEEMIKSGQKGKVSLNVHESNVDRYLIGDNPIVFRRTPHAFSEFGSIDYLIALTSRRVYSSTSSELVGLKAVNGMIYNAVVIHQSTQYVASGNYQLLENSIKFYEELKKRGVESQMQEYVFHIVS